MVIAPSSWPLIAFPPAASSFPPSLPQAVSKVVQEEMARDEDKYAVGLGECALHVHSRELLEAHARREIETELSAVRVDAAAHITITDRTVRGCGQRCIDIAGP